MMAHLLQMEHRLLVQVLLETLVLLRVQIQTMVLLILLVPELQLAGSTAPIVLYHTVDRLLTLRTFLS
jgi:hypothetical protein